MMGTPDNPGVIPLCVEEIFRQISSTSDRVFLIRVGYIEIYNEKIFDLLKPERPEVSKIRENNGTPQVDQQELVSTNIDEIMQHYDNGNKMKKVGETGMNERSSRSHTIFRITIESREENEGEGAVQVSHLNLVDLAGSERLDQTGATGDRLQEGKNINLSLLALSNVIRHLAEKKDGYVNMRDSKLTRILSPSLGGNAVTAIICTITPVALEESNSTLNFAQNAKKIKNQPKVNKIMTDEAMMKQMQRTIEDLRKKLEVEMLKNNNEVRVFFVLYRFNVLNYCFCSLKSRWKVKNSVKTLTIVNVHFCILIIHLIDMHKFPEDELGVQTHSMIPL